MNHIRFCLLAVFFFRVLMAPLAAHSDQAGLPHHVIRCMILDRSGKVIRNYGAGNCQFLNDGSLAMGKRDKLIFFNPDMSIRWEKKMHTHHQLNLSIDEKNLLVMTSSYHHYKNRFVQFDRLSLFDFQGNELFAFDFYSHRKEIDKLAAFNPPLWKLEGEEVFRSDVIYENSHANSFYEIGANESASRLSAFAPGNFIVHANMRGLTLILSHDLKKVLWSAHLTSDCSPGHRENIHDVQVNASGKLIYYNNFAEQCDLQYSIGRELYSDIEEFDPITNKRTVKLKPRVATKFYSSFCGGVQELPDGHILTSDNSNGGMALEFDRDGKLIWSIPDPYINPKTGLHPTFQQIRRLDLSSFLKKNSGY